MLVGAAAVWPLLPVHPPLACPLRTLTGIPCPLCGMTRACVAAVHGHLGASLAFNPAGVLVVVAAVVALIRPQWLHTRPRARPGSSALAFGALWLWNIGFNPTFHQLLLRTPRAPSYSLDVAAAFERAAERHLVGVLEVAADGQPARDSRHEHAERLQQTREIHRGRFAFDVGIGREDDLVDTVLLDTREQLLDAQLLGADAFDRRDRTLQHVVATLELTGALDRDDVARLLDDAQHRGVAAIVAAVRAELALGDVEALPAPRDALLRVDDRGREAARVDRIDAQQVERDALRRLRADAGQAGRARRSGLNRTFVERQGSPQPSSPPRSPRPSAPRSSDPRSGVTAPSFSLLQLLRLAGRFVHGRDHEIFERLDVGRGRRRSGRSRSRAARPRR